VCFYFSIMFKTILSCCLLSLVFSTQRPNIVFIFADDWGWGDLSCHGHPYVKTPNLDRLASEGTDFQRFTVASGVCSPSRAAVMTGHFPARYSIDGHFAWVPSNEKRGMPDWLDLDAPYLAEMLQGAGYRTAHYGKWHLANNMIPDSPSPGEYGYDDYGAFNCSGEQMPWYKDADRTNAFMEESVKAGKPFFINVWMHEPHTPHHTVPKYEWMFQDLENDERVYASVLAHADARIGQMLDKLDELGVADNTLVIFSSDNGPETTYPKHKDIKLIYDTATGAGWAGGTAAGLTGGRKGHKHTIFEGGVGVPFIARWPKQIAAGKIDDESLISAVDLLPTFCQLAGAELPKNYTPDGVDISNVLKGEKMPSRSKPLFWKMATRGENSPKHSPTWARWAVVKDQWKLLASGGLATVELYDISGDYQESVDLSAEKPEVVKELFSALKNWQASLPEAPSGNVFSKERQK